MGVGTRLGPSLLEQFREKGQFTEQEVQRTGFHKMERRTVRQGFGKVIRPPVLVGVAQPGPVFNGTHTQDRSIVQLKFVQFKSHPFDTRPALALRFGIRKKGQRGPAEGGQGDAFQRIWIGSGIFHRFIDGHVPVDIGPIDPLLHGRPNRGNDGLAGVKRDVTACRTFIAVRFRHHHDADDGQPPDPLFNRVLNGSR